MKILHLKWIKTNWNDWNSFLLYESSSQGSGGGSLRIHIKTLILLLLHSNIWSSRKIWFLLVYILETFYYLYFTSKILFMRTKIKDTHYSSLINWLKNPQKKINLHYFFIVLNENFRILLSYQLDSPRDLEIFRVVCANSYCRYGSV